MRLTCGNHALRCPGMPGKVCTVVPASGSRSNVQDHQSPAQSKGSWFLSYHRHFPRTGLKHQVRTAAGPSMPKPGQDSRQRHRPNSDRHEEWTPRSVDKRVLARNADYLLLRLCCLCSRDAR